MIRLAGLHGITKRIICAIIVFAVFLPAADILYAAKKRSMIIIYNSGRQIKLTSKSGKFYKLRRACEKLLRKADSRLRLDDREKVISSIRQNETAVEVIYSRPKRITIKPFDKKRVRVTRLIIPATGRFAADDAATIFYWDAEDEMVDLFVNSKGVAEFKALVDSAIY
ncbi:hypothetical protein OAA99_00920 [Omnitrophica bacterium]|nr:hypothetical protein [Candidatus Omnitrophota bacterium]